MRGVLRTSPAACFTPTAAVCCWLQSHPQAIYYSLRTFVLGLRESAQRALQDYSRQRASLEAQLQAALEAAGGDMESECLFCSCAHTYMHGMQWHHD